jgi:uncharacterized protein YpmS
MMDLLTILLIAFLILLVVQIIALVRIRYIIVRLRSILNVITPILEKTYYVQRANQVNMHTCQFCKYRQAYIKTTASGDEDFYYRCKVSDKEIKLNDTCRFFEPERTL